ncbi:heterokaryon incompatibility protein [Colletotrichum musicola]|uniref:Heterokaryon incompatibility protein n=1 Tax=Colletotrichum musicola TaxID=2175873 RepID=A0A8H6NWC1_9PEZI|nr:heterokaryon incompatibility protein [Colletotrichum musicola]
MFAALEIGALQANTGAGAAPRPATRLVPPRARQPLLGPPAPANNSQATQVDGGGTIRWQPVEILPKTFRDAVIVAKRFQIRYLWIDRLCIYQDSADDWRHESSGMQHVYRNGLLNVSAFGAHSGDDGLFFSRLPWKEKLSTAVEFRLSPEAEAARLTDIFVPFKPHSFELFNQNPLVLRGWVLQERLLAPRVLHFGRHQAYWECRQGHRFPGGADTGELTGGSITLDGPLGLLEVGINFPGTRNICRVQSIRHDSEKMTGFHFDFLVAIGWVYFDTASDVTDEAHILVLGRSNSELDDFRRWVGLALAPAGNGTHRRIGLVVMEPRSNTAELQDWVQQAPRRQVTIV